MVVELQACYTDARVELSRHSRAVAQKADNLSLQGCIICPQLEVFISSIL